MWQSFGSLALEPPSDRDRAGVVVPPRDGFADPPAILVREDVLAAVGPPEAVRAGALADLVARVEEAGYTLETRAAPTAPRRASVAALLREGSGRFWLFRRHPDRFPLPKPDSVGPLRWLVMLVGALHANAGRPA
jgi:hypothetical protein